MRELQDDYTREPRLVRRGHVQHDVRALHGGRRPWWLLKPEPPPVAPFEFDWTPAPDA